MVITEKIKKLYYWFLYRYEKRKQQALRKPSIQVDHMVPVRQLGTSYGGWKVPEGFLDEHSICYFAGAGIDISFDVEVSKLFKSKVYIIDPTPQAKSHFNELIERTANGEKLEIDRKRGLYYEVDLETLKRIEWLDVGLWGEDTIIRFYEPSNNRTMVSHSITNLHRTKKFFEAKVVTLSTLMHQLKHPHIDYLKIDIEGAEYEVIRSLIKDQLDVRVLGIEFDEVHHPLDQHSISRIEDAIRDLRNYGFAVVDVDDNYNVTFVQKELYQRRYSQRT
jgi:FkbM family methyltransferase